MAHSQLSCDGTFTKDPPRARLSYSVMLLVRGKMPGVFSVQLAQAVTIATRYSMVRAQGLGHGDALKSEATIVQYKHQHFRLLSLLAKTCAMYFASQACDAKYSQLREMQAQAPADHSLLSLVHALAAGLKAYVTSEATDSAEDCRKLCGGHGYMVISGLPDIIGAVAGGATFEGENYVLWQQTARYLLKQLDRLQDGGDVDAQTQYLTATKDPIEPCIASGKQFLDPDVQLVIYRDRARRLVLTAHTAIRASRMTPAEA
jgi:acyl-CoA oxidase